VPTLEAFNEMRTQLDAQQQHTADLRSQLAHKELQTLLPRLINDELYRLAPALEYPAGSAVPTAESVAAVQTWITARPQYVAGATPPPPAAGQQPPPAGGQQGGQQQQQQQGAGAWGAPPVADSAPPILFQNEVLTEAMIRNKLETDPKAYNSPEFQSAMLQFFYRKQQRGEGPSAFPMR